METNKGMQIPRFLSFEMHFAPPKQTTRSAEDLVFYSSECQSSLITHPRDRASPRPPPRNLRVKLQFPLLKEALAK